MARLPLILNDVKASKECRASGGEDGTRQHVQSAGLAGLGFGVWWGSGFLMHKLG